MFALTLTGSELHYYEDETAFQKNSLSPQLSAIIGTIDLTTPGLFLRIVNETTFEICTPKRTYQLIAPDVDALCAWIMSLSTYWFVGVSVCGRI